MIELPPRLTIEGDVDAQDELVIRGEVRGTIWAEAHTVEVAAAGLVNGQIIAAEVIVKGSVNGSILAERHVEIFAGGMVEGRIASPRFIVQDGAIHRGTFQPNRVEMAFRVARHRREQAAGHTESLVEGPPTGPMAQQ